MTGTREVSGQLQAGWRGKPGGGHRVRLYILHTRTPNTGAALKRAASLAQGLDAAITVLAPVVVPYPLPLLDPPISIDFLNAALTREALRAGVDATIQVLLCRDRLVAFRDALAPRSIVLLGDRRGWWPGPERRLAWTLRRDGHTVLLIDPNLRPSLLSAGLPGPDSTDSIPPSLTTPSRTQPRFLTTDYATHDANE